MKTRENLIADLNFLGFEALGKPEKERMIEITYDQLKDILDVVMSEDIEEKLQQRIDDLEEEVSDLEYEGVSLENELDEAKGEIDRLENENSNLRDQVAELKDEIELMEEASKDFLG